jgi:cell fate regulator YaaT (PSP1 superfamily)
MAKEQGLSLNSTKISGTCGRLMCCLNYEYSTYKDEIEKMPSVESIVDTPEGRGVVTEIAPLAGTVKVKLTVKQDTIFKTFHRDECKIIVKKEIKEENNQ